VEPHRRVVQAKALLALADGASVRSTAAELGSYPNTVSRWRTKYLAGGVEDVGSIAPGRGRKKRVDQPVVEAIVNDTLHTVPDDGSTQWSTRTMAARRGVSHDFVARIWRARGDPPEAAPPARRAPPALLARHQPGRSAAHRQINQLDDWTSEAAAFRTSTESRPTRPTGRS
jgi:transposase